jgi:hypothetical protein
VSRTCDCGCDCGCEPVITVVSYSVVSRHALLLLVGSWLWVGAVVVIVVLISIVVVVVVVLICACGFCTENGRTHYGERLSTVTVGILVGSPTVA